ncbi:RagB/SusD family nutrient uptake outer membrane protein [Polaribacter sp.]|uniref:RagB/SusD family nutrient uptake outer membrane protein n=1 Tax=Polaribacter sp. TaxID=1920175 RepID=UPI003F6D9229
MKTQFTKLFLLLVAITSLNSCDKELDIQDTNRLLADEYYQSQSEAVAAVDAIYNGLIIDGNYQRMMPAINDARGDEASSRSPWPFLTGTGNFTIPSTQPDIIIAYLGCYTIINRANQALAAIDQIDDIEANLRKRLIGQAYFLRALAYFNASNIFENPPLVLEVQTGADTFFPSNQSTTQADVYAQVESDLNEAISRLPASYSSISGPDAGQPARATLGAANSLMGKLKLYQNDYAGAIPYFEAVVNSQMYDLAPNYGDLFSQDPALENANPGRIFWAEFTQSANVDFNWGGDPTVNWRQFSAVAPTYSGADFYDFTPTQFLVDELKQERTINNEIDPRYPATILSFLPAEGLTQSYGAPYFLDQNQNYLAKYTLANEGGDPFTCGINYHIIRFADVLLMYAECLANTNNIASAATQVQRVRDRANLPDREAEFAALNLTQFMDQLAHERVTELAIEGLRWYDIKRWGWLDDATKLNELKAHDIDFDSYTPGRQFQPFPQSELDRNPNLVGNTAN